MISIFNKSVTAALLAGTLLAAPAQAQFGGMLGKAKSAAGLGSSDTQARAMSGDEADAFLTASLRSTKNVMIATALLAEAVQNRGPLTARKAQIEALNSISNFKELSAHKSTLSADIAALNARQDLSADINARYQAGTAEEKKLLGVAVVNFAIGIARNVDLVGKAPQVLDAVKRNPQLLTRVGQFKLAAELVGLQGKGLAGVATSVPKLIAATKVRAPKDAKTSEPQPVSFI